LPLTTGSEVSGSFAFISISELDPRVLIAFDGTFRLPNRR
jgi:hypothetical protein